MLPASAFSMKPAHAVIIRAPGTRYIADRIEKELALLGIRVEQVPETAREPEDAVRLWRADAVVFVRARAPRLSIWVRRPNGEAVPVDVPAQPDASDEMIALRATELLRGHFLPVGPKRAPAETEPAAPEREARRGSETPPATEPARSAEPAFSLRVAAGPAFETTVGKSPAFGVTASTGVLIAPRVELGVLALFPLGASDADVSGRSVELRQIVAGITGRYHFDLAKPWLLDAAACAGTRAASYDVLEPASIEASSGTRFGALFGAVLGGGLRLNPVFALRAEASFFAGPPLEITVEAPGQGNSTRGVRLGATFATALALEARL